LIPFPPLGLERYNLFLVIYPPRCPSTSPCSAQHHPIVFKPSSGLPSGHLVASDPSGNISPPYALVQHHCTTCIMVYAYPNTQLIRCNLASSLSHRNLFYPPPQAILMDIHATHLSNIQQSHACISSPSITPRPHLAARLLIFPVLFCLFPLSLSIRFPSIVNVTAASYVCMILHM